MCENTTRQCARCKQDKPATLEFFYKNKADKRLGLGHSCKVCINAGNAARKITPLVKEVLADGQKRCTACKEIKRATLEDFGPHRRTRDHLNCYCRKCSAALTMQKYVHKPRQWANRQKPGFLRCAHCLEFKPMNNCFFSRSIRSISGFRNYCKVCDALMALEWSRANPEKSRAKCHKRRRLARNSTEHFTADDIISQLTGQKGKCYWCQRQLIITGKGKYHVDHLIPLNRGGSNGPGNIVCACPACNLSRNDKLPYEWTDRLL